MDSRFAITMVTLRQPVRAQLSHEGSLNSPDDDADYAEPDVESCLSNEIYEESRRDLCASRLDYCVTETAHGYSIPRSATNLFAAKQTETLTETQR